MDQISLAVVNTIYFKTILTLIRQPMYHFRVQSFSPAVSDTREYSEKPTWCFPGIQIRKDPPRRKAKRSGLQGGEKSALVNISTVIW